MEGVTIIFPIALTYLKLSFQDFVKLYYNFVLYVINKYDFYVNLFSCTPEHQDLKI